MFKFSSGFRSAGAAFANALHDSNAAGWKNCTVAVFPEVATYRGVKRLGWTVVGKSL